MVGHEIGQYKVLEKIGKGGMGIVYKGIHTRLEQLVAIKVLSTEYSQEPAMRERFIQEARLQARLSHPNVVNILNYFEEDNNVYLVMEYVHGETLEAKLQRTGAFTFDECKEISISVLDALSFMHSQKIIHRDIKPSNIMLTDTGQVKVTDFGIAASLTKKGLTKTGMRLGTAYYMSPEQIKGERINETSDIYSLGITLYQMITGRVPFDKDSEFEIMNAHLEELPSPPISLNSQIPKELNAVIMRSIAKNSKERFQTAQEYKNALTRVEEKTDDFNRTIVSTALKDHFARRISKKSFYLTGSIVLLCIAFVILLFLGGGKELKENTLVKQMPDTASIDTSAAPSEHSLNLSHQSLKTNEKLQKSMPGNFTNLNNPIGANKKNGYFERGKQFYEDRKYNEAVNEFKQALSIDSGHKEAKKYLELAEMKIMELTRINMEEEKKKKADEYYSNGLKLLNSGDILEAIINFNAVMKINPGHKEAQENLDLAMKKLEEFKIEEEKKEIINEYYSNGLRSYNAGNFPQAIVSFEKVLKLDSEHKEARKYLELAKIKQFDNKIVPGTTENINPHAMPP